jgi:hypothetical protein
MRASQAWARHGNRPASRTRCPGSRVVAFQSIPFDGLSVGNEARPRWSKPRLALCVRGWFAGCGNVWSGCKWPLSYASQTIEISGEPGVLMSLVSRRKRFPVCEHAELGAWTNICSSFERGGSCTLMLDNQRPMCSCETVNDSEESVGNLQIKKGGVGSQRDKPDVRGHIPMAAAVGDSCLSPRCSGKVLFALY